MELERDDLGRFAIKGDDIRHVRAIRATEDTWNAFGDQAKVLGISRADYLEHLMSDEVGLDSDGDRNESASDFDFDPEEAAEILQEALTLKANAGGAIKAEIRKALELMGFDEG